MRLVELSDVWREFEKASPHHQPDGFSASSHWIPPTDYQPERKNDVPNPTTNKGGDK